MVSYTSCSSLTDFANFSLVRLVRGQVTSLLDLLSEATRQVGTSAELVNFCPNRRVHSGIIKNSPIVRTYGAEYMIKIHWRSAGSVDCIPRPDEVHISCVTSMSPIWHFGCSCCNARCEATCMVVRSASVQGFQRYGISAISGTKKQGYRIHGL